MPPESPQQPKKEIHPPLFIAILLVIAGLIGSFQVWQVLNPIIRTPLKTLSLEEIKNNAQCSDAVICPDDYRCIKTDNLPRANGICVSQFSDWETYRNEEYGFEFKYPGGWRVTADNEEVCDFGPGGDSNVVCSNITTVEKDIHGSAWLNIHKNECNDTSISGWVSYKDNMVGKLVCKNSFELDLGFFDESSNKNSKVILDQILSTFKFIK